MNDLIKEAYKQLYGDLGNNSGGIDPRLLSAEDEDAEMLFSSTEIVKKQQEARVREGKGPNVPNFAEIEESVNFKRFRSKRQHKYTEEEMEAIREGCERTFVHDYTETDIFHTSDEERIRFDTLSEIRPKLQKLKKVYRRIDEFIEAMRVVVQAWGIFERTNVMHTRKEFYQMVARGDIVSGGIIMPKMKGLDKFDLDTVIKYISNPNLNPADLMPRDYGDDEWATEDTSEDAMRLISNAEAEWITEHIDDPPAIRVKEIPAKFIEGYDQRNALSVLKKRHMSKKDRQFAQELHAVLNHIQNAQLKRAGGNYMTHAYLVANSMFSVEKEEKSPLDQLHYDGSWTNKSSLLRYDTAVDDLIQSTRVPGQQWMTFGEQSLNQFFADAEAAGINVLELRQKMNMTEETMQRRENKKVKKQNEKIEASLLKRIQDLNNNPKFKKIVNKAEKQIANEIQEYS